MRGFVLSQLDGSVGATGAKKPLSADPAREISSRPMTGVACARVELPGRRARPTLVELESHHRWVDGIGAWSGAAFASVPGLSRAVVFTGTKRRMRPTTNGETFVAGADAWRGVRTRLRADAGSVARRLRPAGACWNNVSAANVMAVTAAGSLD